MVQPKAKDPRYNESGKALEVRTTYYDRDPYPKFWTATVQANQQATLKYQNGTEELSEVKRVQIQGHPDITVSIKRTKDNQDQGVFEQRRIGDLPIIDGIPTIEFRKVSADSVLIIEKNQQVNVELNHALLGPQTVIVNIDKQAVRFYLAR